MRSNTDMNIEMNFMPAADSRFLMYGQVEVYEIQYRFEYRNEFHASSRFAFFYVWTCGWVSEVGSKFDIRSSIFTVEMNMRMS